MINRHDSDIPMFTGSIDDLLKHSMTIDPEMVEQKVKDNEKRMCIDHIMQECDCDEFEAEKILLTEELKKKKEAEIKTKEQELKDFRNLKFGYEGELFKKRQELVKPIQDKVYNAIQKTAKARAYDFIFAKGGEVVMLYTNSKYDMSNEVLAELGIAIDKSSKNQLKPENPAPQK